MRFRSLSKVTAFALACGFAFSAAAAHADVIKIGLIGPMTGPVTQYGDMVREGAMTAVEVINASGGVKGHTFELVFIDDACESKQGAAAANRVVSEKISFVVGPVCSGPAVTAADIFDDEGILMVAPSATAPVLTDGKNYETIFRLIGRDDQQGPVAAKYIIERVKPRNVVILHDKQSYGQGVATVVRDALQKAGVNVAFFEGINVGDSDYSAIVTRMKSAGVDFVYFGGYHPEMGLLMRQAAEQGLKVTFMGPEGSGNPEIIAIAGPAVEGMLLTLPADFSGNPENAKIVEAFKSKGRNAAGAFQLTSYAAVQAIALGIEATGSTDPEVIAKYLHNNTLHTAIGETSWNAQGDLNEFKFQIFSWHKDGSQTLMD